MDLLLNDDVLGAEKAVEGGHSSYHKVLSQTSLPTTAVFMETGIIICPPVGVYSLPAVSLHFSVQA